MKNRYAIRMINFGYSLHADSYPEAIRLGIKSGFEFVITDRRDNIQLAAYTVAGSFQEKKNLV